MTADAEAPLVSVVLRTYNHASFVAQAIESVLIQDTAFPFELVIGEDCSTDGTREIVAEYAARDPQIVRAVLPEQNIGHGAIFKQALEATRGSLIAYLDGDDYWTSRSKLTRQVDFLERNPECASCFHDVSLVYGEAGQPSGTVSPELGEERFSVEQIIMDSFVPAPAMMFRREVVEGLPAWVFESAWIDWLINIRSAQLGPLGYLPSPLAAYRVHKDGMFSGLDRVSQLEEDLTVYEQLASEIPDQADLIERCVGFRHAQLAIERLGVSFDSCVVLVDPRREMRPYFNGRHARNVPRREDHEVTELQAISEATGALSRATRDYGPEAPSGNGQHACYVVIPKTAMEWVAGRPQLQHFLANHSEVAWEDDSAVVHKLEPVEEAEERAAGRGARRRVDVNVLARPAALAGGFLDAPAANAMLPAHAVSVIGWVLGREQPATAVEFRCDGELIWRAPTQVDRPDVSAEFPDLAAEAPGFETTLNAEGLPGGSVVDVSAILADGTAHPFAQLNLH
jgi:Glycosyl transferase family 2